MTVQKTGQIACHVGVREVAMAAAGQMYEQLMSNNTMFARWRAENPGCNPKQLEKRFIDQNWAQCILFARATLTKMLSQPNISDSMKEDIMDILEKDQFLRQRTGTVH